MTSSILLAAALSAGPAADPFDAQLSRDVVEKELPVVALPAKIARRHLRYQDEKGAKQAAVVMLGEMLFHAPRMLGVRATHFGLSCNICHPNGAANPEILLPESYGVAGRIDLSSDYFGPDGDDGMKNPHRIPGLRGVRMTGPFPLNGNIPSLREFIRHVAVVEFGSAEPPPRFVDAIARFLEQLDPLPNSKLDAQGHLTAKAGEDARRGEQAFLKVRKDMDNQSCATCHPPERFFTDNQRHVLNKTETSRFESPGFIALKTTPPYLADGSAKTIEEMMDTLVKRLGIDCPPAERADLVAYLKAVGDEDEPWENLTPAEEAGRSFAFLDLLNAGPYMTDGQVWKMTLHTVDHELDVQIGALTNAKPELEKAWKSWHDVAMAAVKKAPNAADRKALGEAKKAILAALPEARPPRQEKKP
jgi:cytochrome c peroxidase